MRNESASKSTLELLHDSNPSKKYKGLHLNEEKLIDLYTSFKNDNVISENDKIFCSAMIEKILNGKSGDLNARLIQAKKTLTDKKNVAVNALINITHRSHAYIDHKEDVKASLETIAKQGNISLNAFRKIDYLSQINDTLSDLSELLGDYAGAKLNEINGVICEMPSNYTASNIRRAACCAPWRYLYWK